MQNMCELKKTKNQMLTTTLSFLKAFLNQAGRQTTSLSVVNNPYDRITSANTSSKNLQSWQQALDESTKHARSHPLSRTRNPARTHIHTHEESLKITFIAYFTLMSSLFKNTNLA